MTGNTIAQFNDFFVENYNYLLGFSRSIDIRNDYEDLLHNCYIKCNNRIRLSGYSGTSFMNFIRVTIMNTYKTFYRDRKHTVDFESQNYSQMVEEILLNDYDNDVSRKQYINDVQFINTMIYEYVNKYFNQKENMIFKTYYLLKYKHLNYKQLADATGYSITSVSNTIKNIKKELKFNLECYINTNYNVMELKELLLKVELVLKTDVRQNKQNYQEVYKLIYNKPWSGCNCNLLSLKQGIQTWYEKNKQYLNN